MTIVEEKTSRYERTRS